MELAEATKPLVSVLIPNFNGAEVLLECVQSVIEQSFPSEEIEILVHDDASTDQSMAMLREAYGDINVIYSSKNVGFCLSCNRLASQAQGKYLLFLNNDAVLDKSAISSLFQFQQDHSDAGIISLSQRDYDTDAVIDYGYGVDLFYNPFPLKKQNQNLAMVFGACLWIDARLWDELEGFPEFFESIGEDLYLCIAVLALGKQVSIAPESYYRHRIGHSFGGGKVQNSSLVTTYRRRRLSESNKAKVMLIFTPWYHLLWLFPLHLSALIAEAATISIFRFTIKPVTQIYSPAALSVARCFACCLRARRRFRSMPSFQGLNFEKTVSFLPSKLVMLWKHGLPKLH